MEELADFRIFCFDCYSTSRPKIQSGIVILLCDNKNCNNSNRDRMEILQGI